MFDAPTLRGPGGGGGGGGGFPVLDRERRLAICRWRSNTWSSRDDMMVVFRGRVPARALLSRRPAGRGTGDRRRQVASREHPERAIF